jgi:hypothetical protein
MLRDAWRCLLVLIVIAAWKDNGVSYTPPQVYNYPPQYQPVVEDRPFQRVGRATMELAESLWKVVR